MGITKTHFNNILGNIFKEGNIIRLYKNTPDETSETGGELLTGTEATNGVVDYKIKAGDFSIDGGEVTSARNIMFYMYNDEDSVTCDGFGIFDSSNSLLYFGEFENPITLDYNDVPAIKKYNETKQEGIKVTIKSTETSAATTA